MGKAENYMEVLRNMNDWVRGNLLERRSVAAANCEPRLLKKGKCKKGAGFTG